MINRVNISRIIKSGREKPGKRQTETRPVPVNKGAGQDRINNKKNERRIQGKLPGQGEKQGQTMT